MCLVEEVEAKGFVGVQRFADHRNSTARFFDRRAPSRGYLQSVLASDWLWASGCVFLSAAGHKPITLF